MYEYLVWDGLLGIIWLLFYLVQPALRRKMLWSSLIALPFGFGELYFYPNYWVPKTLFGFGEQYHLAIESFLVMFFLGGTAAALYELISKDYLPKKQKFCGKLCRCYLPLCTSLAAFVILIKAFPDWNIIYPSVLACLAGGLLAFTIYPKLRMHVALGGLLFMLLYGISLAVMDLLFPGWIASVWNMSALSGVTIIAVPVEELFFGFAFGTLWAPLFEETCSNLGM